jgi:hypothetical protein
MLFIPVDIPSKYMPLAMYALFCLFGGPQLSYAVAILVGYAQVQGYLDRYRPSSGFLEELEAADGSLHGVRQGKGYVPAGASGHDAWIPVNAEASWAGPGDASASTHGHQDAHPAMGGRSGIQATTATAPPKDMVCLILECACSILLNVPSPNLIYCSAYVCVPRLRLLLTLPLRMPLHVRSSQAKGTSSAAAAAERAARRPAACSAPSPRVCTAAHRAPPVRVSAGRRLPPGGSPP